MVFGVCRGFWLLLITSYNVCPPALAVGTYCSVINNATIWSFTRCQVWYNRTGMHHCRSILVVWCEYMMIVCLLKVKRHLTCQMDFFLGLFTGHDPTRGSDQEVFEFSRVGSGQEVFEVSRVGSGPVRFWPDPWTALEFFIRHSSSQAVCTLDRNMQIFWFYHLRRRARFASMIPYIYELVCRE